MYRYASQLLRRDVPTQMIVNRLIEHRSEYDYDDYGGDTSARKSRWKDKNKHQKEMLRRSWQHDLDAINRRGCAIEYAQEIEEEDRHQAFLVDEDIEHQRWRFHYRPLFILSARFSFRDYHRAEQMFAMTVHEYNASYERAYTDRYRQHLNNLARKRIAEEERKLDEADMRKNAETPQPSPDDDVEFCKPPVVVINGKAVTVLQRDPDAQRQFGAALNTRRQREAPYRFWERTPERQPAKPSKYDKGDDY